MKIKKYYVFLTSILIIILLFSHNCLSLNINIFEINGRTKQIYYVHTSDNQQITLTRYVGYKSTPILLIHGASGNYLMFDFDENHSLARFLNDAGWDVWLLDLRTHDADGDFLFVKNSDIEYINRYWDFDRTFLKIDLVTAVDFVKKVTLKEKIFLGGHSSGGYLSYAYAMIIGEQNLMGIITTGACPYENPPNFQPGIIGLLMYGIPFRKKVFTNPIGIPHTSRLKLFIDLYVLRWKPTENELFYYTTTPETIQKSIVYNGDNEPAGFWVDMFYGKHPTRYDGHWVDPQTLYDYSANLDKITVPILFIAGENDTQDPAKRIYCAYENVSSEIKEFFSFTNHSHLDLLLGDYSNQLIFPKITSFMDKVVTTV